MNALSPVILAVPEHDLTLSARERVSYLSKYARDALAISAKKSSIDFGKPLKDAKGVPIPVDGYYWSVSHKPKYVAGVVACSRVGIDIEEIRDCGEALYRKIAGRSEWELTDADKRILFFRYWTSKEAVLKAVGTGLKDIGRCRILKVIDGNNLLIDYMDRTWSVEHLFFNGHIASLNKGLYDINWHCELCRNL